MAPPRRIGVLTFHRCINYGSYWQARCLVEGLRAEGHDAVLLDHRSSRIDVMEWRCALHPVPGAASTHRASYAAKARNFFAAFDRLPLSPPFPLEAPEEAGGYDLVLVGSDEVWNLCHPWYGGKGLFFGDGLGADRLASYAASFGNQPSEGGLDPYWSERLGRFASISVRDRNSQELVDKATGRRPALVLDPCLQFAELIPSEPAELGGHYAIVYGHGFPPWLIDAVSAWARRNECRLVSLGYHNPWADEQRIDAGPEEFAALLAGSSAVVTNFFHGCVFALLNDKPFATAPSDYRQNKIRDLVSALGACTHLISPDGAASAVESALGNRLDPQIGRRIASLRRASRAYLDDILA